MDLTDIKELYRNREAYIDKEVTVGGWVRSIRDSKTFGFIVINDGTFFEPLQIVYGDTLSNFDAISKLNVGSAIIARGKIVATPQAKQAFEMQAAEILVEGASTADYPLQKKRHSFEYLRTISHLRPRTNTFQAVFRVRSLIAYAIHTFFQERGFVLFLFIRYANDHCRARKTAPSTSSLEKGFIINSFAPRRSAFIT